MVISLHRANSLWLLNFMRGDIYFNKLNLCSLYESLVIVSRDLKTWVDPDEERHLLILGLIWLLQLRLNAIFELSLKVNASHDLERITKGLRLTKITIDDGKFASKEAFETYFLMFYKCNTLHLAMAPFFSRSHGIYWFRKSFSAFVGCE